MDLTAYSNQLVALQPAREREEATATQNQIQVIQYFLDENDAIPLPTAPDGDRAGDHDHSRG